ncbi:EIN3-binding F-box protein 1-like isoform X1 [Panicum virgatum]|uniref:F-box domain-containing protein n=1 Tax=Panicum virgatum TaxID=38727 RepID=A0A8T0WF13_PANVG|nr:EIN3-binding F-box protein 1-like isoform X1 [Panicum virgatum]KAG2644766.1 hypothetical protein PVAP13_2KG376300 [Panicum virgatum]KAG2644767.1 hypothetical protein PVAP13_2KG376300 [Panicum virgatum]
MYQSRVLQQDLINMLPEACIAEIFRHLENSKDRESCASVCWRWADILVSQQPDFWSPFSVHQAVHRCLHLSDVDDAKLVEAVVGIHSRGVVTDLDLHNGPREAVFAGGPQLTDTAIRFVTTACRNLKSVCLVNCLSLTNKAAWIIASNCPALENLVILQSSISDDGLSQVAKQCRNLKSLRIEGSLSITEASLKALVQDARRLESLALGSYPQIREDAILTLLMNQPYLDKLELKGMMAGESHWIGARQSSALNRHFRLFRQLSSLILVKCPGLQDLGMLKFARIQFRMLRHLVIDDCRVTDRGLIWLVGDAMNPMKLKTIKLARFQFYTAAAAMKVISFVCETIESIILDSCDFGIMTPLHLDGAVARWCPKLRVLRMEHCEKIMYLFLSWVDKACRGLKEIRLIGSPAPVDDHGIAGRLSSILHRNRIAKIEMRSCHVTDMHVCIIARSSLEALQELILDECPKISGNFTVFLRAHCPNLIKLGLNRVQINDGDIKSLMVAGFEHLEELNLMGCPLITKNVLRILATSSLPKLRRVNLSDCPNVMQETIDSYGRYCGWEIEN